MGMLVQTERPQCQSITADTARSLCEGSAYLPRPGEGSRSVEVATQPGSCRGSCCGVEGLLARVQGLGGAGCGVPAACRCQSAPSRPVDRWATAAAQRRSTLPEKTVAFSTQSPCWRSLIQW